MVYPDTDGYYKGAGQAKRRKVKNALEAEFQGLIIAIQHAWSLGFTRIDFEGDSKKIIDIMNKQMLHFEMYN